MRLNHLDMPARLRLRRALGRNHDPGRQQCLRLGTRGFRGGTSTGCPGVGDSIKGVGHATVVHPVVDRDAVTVAGAKGTNLANSSVNVMALRGLPGQKGLPHARRG